MVHRGTIGLVRITFLALALGQYLVEAHQSLQLSSTRTRGGSSTAVSDEAATTSNMATDQTIKVVFSDVDGTLAHYPEDVESIAEERGNKIVRLPPSSTGMRGIISSRTFVKAKQIREKGVKLVLISGMRTATLLKRLPYLPRADAYCSEAGGRIFYPSDKGFLIEPVEFDGASKEDLQSFCVTEDVPWRLKMEQPDAAGKEGYIGNPFDDAKQDPVPVELRTSALWTHAQHLVKLGYVIDSKGYSSCFRLTRNQQEADAPDGDFDDLMNGKIACPPELGTSTNLGSVDFYPIASGKKNCCLYLAEKFTGSPESLAANCVCMCDDDNDVEMALACLHAFIPSVGSESMAQTIREHDDKFTQTETDGIEGTQATEAALERILERIQ